MSLLCLFVTIEWCVSTLRKWPKLSYFTKHFVLYLNLVDTWVHSFVLISVTAFEIFTGEKIFAYLHHWVIELWRKTNLTNIQSWIYFLFNLALIQFLQKHWILSLQKCVECFKTSTIRKKLNFRAFVQFLAKNTLLFYLRLAKKSIFWYRRPSFKMFVIAFAGCMDFPLDIIRRLDCGLWQEQTVLHDARDRQLVCRR